MRAAESAATQRGFLSGGGLPPDGFGSPVPRDGSSGAARRELREWAVWVGALVGCACCVFVIWKLLVLFAAFQALR